MKYVSDTDRWADVNVHLIPTDVMSSAYLILTDGPMSTVYLMPADGPMTREYLIPTDGLMSTVHLILTDGLMTREYLILTDGLMSSISDTNSGPIVHSVVDKCRLFYEL